MADKKTKQTTAGLKKVAQQKLISAIASPTAPKQTNLKMVAVGVISHDNDKLLPLTKTCDEIVWRTVENYFEGEPWTYSELVAAKCCARGIVVDLGMDVAVTMAVASMQEICFAMQQNLCNVMAGTEPED